MRTSRRMLRQIRRALFVAFLFSGCINVLMLAVPLYTLQIFEMVVPVGSLETLMVLTAIAAGGLIALALIELARDRVLLRAGVWLDHELGRHILENGVRSGSDRGELQADQRALTQYRAFLTSPAVNTLFDAPFVPLFLGVLTLLHPLIGLLAGASAGLLLLAALVHTLSTARLQKEQARAAERADQWWRTVAGTGQLGGALGLGPGAAGQWDWTNRAQVAGGYSLGKRTGFIRTFARFVRTSAGVAVYGLGAYLVILGELTPGALVAASILIGRALAPLEQLTGSIKAIRAGLSAYRRLTSLPADAVVPALDESETPLGAIRIADVTVYHPGRKTPALRQLSLQIAPGESIGIVGPNGAGKSTLAAVLAGAIEPTSGAAELDGLPIGKWQRWDGTPPVGYQPDEPALLEGTVHQNIARFRDTAPTSVIRAATMAGVHETLAALPAGYDTLVGPGGSGLSLRERRAVALARALHGGPRLIVLDEPEAGLDGAGLRNLQAVIADLKRAGVGLVIATQDPRLLELVDRIVLLSAGSLQSFGRSSDVISRFEARGRGAQDVGAADTAPAGVH